MSPSSCDPRRTAQITLQSFLQPGAPPEVAKAPVIIPEYVRKRMATDSYGHPEWGWMWKHTVSDTAAPSSPRATLQRCGSSSSEKLSGDGSSQCSSGGKRSRGRPVTPRKDQRSVFGNGVATPIKSNRKQPGVAGRRREIPAWEGKRIAEHLRSERVHFPNDIDYWRAMVIHYKPLPKESLQNVVRKEDMYARRLKDNNKGNAGGNKPRSGANSIMKLLSW